ncbi:redoxin domain-containing protein [Microbacterium elymi]|uniref:Redoxin domain-containing protein n=1 Tax=Microbacterium elymi TaxID=2909587 RepID=A0ABY5NHM8_9MICO|nr:redoxin domain-containing protein [Microbacterium elymi]UUT34677.1 redoxin domain-containing protein [Microbacterium elymi]
MATSHEIITPPAVRNWLLASADPTQADLLRESFATDVEYDFDGRRRVGIDAVLEQLGHMPRGRFANVSRRVIDRGSGRYTVRLSNPDGTPMPSPGGPMLAMDFELGLNQRGLIQTISPNPQHAEPADLQPALRLGDVIPEFSLPDVHGVDTRWFDPSAKASVLIFIANGCPWALGWHDRIQDVVRDYRQQGVRVVQINANDERVSAADALDASRRRIDAGEFASPLLIDEGQTVARRLGARHTPEVFVIDRDHELAYHGAPDADSERPELHAEWLRAALDGVLADAPVTLRETKPMGCTIKWTL